VFENVTLMVLLLALGAGVTVALLVGFIYWMELQDD
jgi:hypothetical protein